MKAVSPGLTEPAVSSKQREEREITAAVGLKLPARAPAMAETSPAAPAAVATTNSRGRVSTGAS